MIKCNLFDVVELNNEDKATILSIEQNTYRVEIVDENGKTKDLKEIQKNDVKKVIFPKQ